MRGKSPATYAENDLAGDEFNVSISSASGGSEYKDI